MVGLVVPRLPEDWLAILRTVQIHFADAVIGGGALRDLLLKKPVKDIDIFVGWSSGDIESLERRIRSKLPWSMLPCQSSLKNYDLNFTGVVQVWNGEPSRLSGKRLQIIALDEPVTVDVVINRCDFGICRIAHDGERFYLHEDFVRDAVDQTFTLRRCSDVSAHSNRWWQFEQRFPGWRLVSEEIDAYRASQPDDDFE
jgi:hypothetical protein